MCLWITAKPLQALEAKDALEQTVFNLGYYEKKKQINIIDYTDFYRQSGVFDGSTIIQQIVKSEKIALENNFDGVRISGNVSWLSKEEWEDFDDYESAVDTIIRGHRIIAICSYPLHNQQPAEIVSIVSNHRNIIIRKQIQLEYIANNGYGYINKLRNKGYSYTKIGNTLGISRQRVFQLINKEKRTLKREIEDYSKKPELLTAQEAAEFLNVHINTIRRWSDNDILPCYRVGQRNDRRFKYTDLEEFLSKKS
jgi:excisionase family DNA binding protein